jgi:hypothetical protein
MHFAHCDHLQLRGVPQVVVSHARLQLSQGVLHRPLVVPVDVQTVLRPVAAPS